METSDLYLAGWLIRCGNKPIDLKPDKDHPGIVIFCFENTEKLIKDKSRYGDIEQ